MGTISVEADLCITMSVLRNNASQDAPRPLSNVVQMRGQAPALSTSCARLTESAICAICDAERHGGIPTQSVGTIITISVEADLCITMSALRGHAARNAPRPICLVAQMFQCPAQSCGQKKCQAHGLALIPATATVRTAASCLAAVACRRSWRRSFPGWPVRSCARRR